MNVVKLTSISSIFIIIIICPFFFFFFFFIKRRVVEILKWESQSGDLRMLRKIRRQRFFCNMGTNKLTWHAKETMPCAEYCRTVALCKIQLFSTRCMILVDKIEKATSGGTTKPFKWKFFKQSKYLCSFRVILENKEWHTAQIKRQISAS